jgi:predicted AlkP superfamily pyrophosphatase or phosphodiesterase
VASRGEPALVVVSIDGLSASVVDDPTYRVPTLRGLAARGVRAERLEPVFPSVTWPCHTTLLTGVSPARHGVLGNHVFDRAQNRIIAHYGDRTERPLRAESLCERAARAGLRTAAVCWPKTRGMGCIDDNVPEFYEQELFERYASRPLWDELAELGLPISRYGEWSRVHGFGPQQDWLSLEVALHVLRRRAPHLMLLHFLVFDSFQHDHGVGSPEAVWALEYVDGLVARLLTALEERGHGWTTDVVVFGDHGFVDVERIALPNGCFQDAGLLHVDRDGSIRRHEARVVSNGGSAHVYVAEGRRRAAVLDALHEQLAALPGVAMVVGEKDFPALGLPLPAEDPTQGDLMITAAEGWHFADDLRQEAVPSRYRATHGHLPGDPRMDAAFVAAGPSFVAGGRVARLHHLDVAPTLAAVLGVALPAAERAPASALLRR